MGKTFRGHDVEHDTDGQNSVSTTDPYASNECEHEL